MNKYFTALLALLALAGGLWLAIVIAPPGMPATKHISLFPQARALPDFSLTDHKGEIFDKARLREHWTLIFVGYTFCPDVCPTTLAELKNIYPQIQSIEASHPIQVVLLSVDPKRDDTARLNEYIQFFHPDFIAASGPHVQLFPMVRAMGMMYSMTDDTSLPNYLVDHSSSVTLINPLAQVVGRFKPSYELGALPISDGQQILTDLPSLVK